MKNSFDPTHPLPVEIISPGNCDEVAARDGEAPERNYERIFRVLDSYNADARAHYGSEEGFAKVQEAANHLLPPEHARHLPEPLRELRGVFAMADALAQRA